MKNSPLVDVPSLQPLRFWMVNAGFTSLCDISHWLDHRWIGWKDIQVPLSLKSECDELLTLFHGLALIHRSQSDKRGWGPSGFYSVTMGYSKLLEIPHVPTNPTTWKGLWKFKSISKVD